MRGALIIILTASVSGMMGAIWALDPNTFDDNVLSRDRYENIFSLWRIEHDVEILEHEMEYRLGVFSDNHDFIAAHNLAGDKMYTLGHNKFSHLTSSEFSQRLGLKRSKLSTQKQDSTSKHKLFRDPTFKLFGQTAVSRRATKLPDSIDWRKEGAVSYVKDQRTCGSCWTFSALGAIEGAYYIKHKIMISLSEQMVVDCDQYDEGCEGGNMVSAFQWIEEHGICSEKDYPYTSEVEACKMDTCVPIQGIKVESWVSVKEKTEWALMEAVTHGPVSVSIEGGLPSFQFYKSGVFHDDACGAELNHGVLLVGYASHPNLGDYWIVKNSWGESWGEDGYVLFKRSPYIEGGECGIQKDASYPILED